jgi:hypothetical protein
VPPQILLPQFLPSKPANYHLDHGVAVFVTECQRNFFPPNYPTVISTGGTAVFAVPEWRNPSSGFLIQVFNLDVIGDCEAYLNQQGFSR